ncbi:MAG: methyl-accepting chemotaxis protein, partial [Pseudoalteromonas sp.]|nr:methyl-accepting chemotaxis protein [Pseudoalteromonas sp.]
MNFLLKLSVAQKIFLIPIIGAVSFITFVVINSIVSAQNASQLQMAKNVDFPALQLSTTVLTNMEKVRDTLASSVTTGDIEAIDAAKEKVKVVVDDLQAVRRIDPSLSADVNVLQSTFSAYS